MQCHWSIRRDMLVSTTHLSIPVPWLPLKSVAVPTRALSLEVRIRPIRVTPRHDLLHQITTAPSSAQPISFSFGSHLCILAAFAFFFFGEFLHISLVYTLKPFYVSTSVLYYSMPWPLVCILVTFSDLELVSWLSGSPVCPDLWLISQIGVSTSPDL